ncbi:MAG: DNA polymerase III subunit beta [Candidatus Neomarinimicrobiota bacterium]
MKLSTSKTELQTVLQKLSKATPSRSTLPILNSVLFTATNEGVLLRATDLEITIIVPLEASLEETGSAAIPLQTLLEITNEMPETRITISVNAQNKVQLITDLGVYDLMGKPAEEFPATPDLDNHKALTLKAEIVRKIIENTSFAVSKDELKPALTGVLFQFGDDRLTAVATDGHRLVRYIRNDYQPDTFFGDIIVPRKFLGLLGVFLSEVDEINARIGEKHLTATLGRDTIITRLIDERFPDYESVIPRDNEKRLEVERDSILGAVRRVSIFSNKSTHQVALRIVGGQGTITTEDPEKASKAQEKLTASYTGDDLTIGYNANYLKDILAHIKSDKIIIDLKTPISAGLFFPYEQEEFSNLTMLLMPIRLND